MHSTYNSWLVGLSIGVAILVSFTSLRLASRVAESKGSAGRAWLILGAFSMGVGIWAMHFIGMLAFSLPIQLRYRVDLTFVSLAAAILTSGFAIKIASSSNLGLKRHLVCSVVMGLGMAISVAPLTTTVMNAVPESESGLASGINNAVSRLAALLAVAVFGAVLVTFFNHSLDRSLDLLALTRDVRAQIDAARPQLAAAHNPNLMVQRAITESFLTGYRAVIWIAAGLSVLGAIAAWLLIEHGAHPSAKQN